MTPSRASVDHPNADPITGEPGAHPVGTGIGAAAGGMAAGAAVGTVAGPVGTLIGAAVGAVVGGLAGKGVAEAIDPTVEEAYWRDNYAKQPYVNSGSTFDDYGPAYGYGLNASGLHPAKHFDDVETELADGWVQARGRSSLDWERARYATRDAWDRARRTET
ncbi:MAG: hypothetical protein M3O01_13340 [Pseudomonadota bacterium]|nr:hypothetical protein [Pseudomonadota bacterium]